MLSFDEYGFNVSILKSLEELSFKVPTDIQGSVIPEILSDYNKDAINTSINRNKKSRNKKKIFF